MTTEVGDGVATIAVTGEVDASNCDELRDVFLASLGDGARNLVVDCAGLTFIDSMGLNAIVAANREVGLQFGTVTIRHASPMVLRLLAATGLDQVLVVED